MKLNVEKITPQKAAEYLTKNVVNRNISYPTVERYADDMKNGTWEVNGQPIVFSKSGKLLDGQHRLSAIAKSGVTVEMTVVRDVDDSVSIYDVGRARSVLDSILIDGYDRDIANPTNVAVARLHYRIQTNKSMMSIHAVKDFLDEHGESLKLLARVRKMGHRNGINLSSALILLPMMYAVEAGEDINKIYEFAECLSTGFYTSESQTSAIVIRNDIILRKIPFDGGGRDRILVCFSIENAIHDFCRSKPRKRSYATSTNPVYSNVEGQ